MSDGYINLTKMTVACGKRLNNYTRSKATRRFLKPLSADMKFGLDTLVQHQYTAQGEHATGGHPETAVDVAASCNVNFKLKVNRLLMRYFMGELTADESKAGSLRFCIQYRTKRLLTCEASERWPSS